MSACTRQSVTVTFRAMPPRPSKRPAGKVICLGTGDGWPCADRNHSSYLYELAGTSLLIDCGESVVRSLTARRYDWNRLDAIVLSHAHADHIGGLPMLLQALWLEGRTRPMRIHLPGALIAPLRTMLRHGYLFDELFRFRLSFVPLGTRQRFRVGGLHITPHPTSHLDGFRRVFKRKHRVGFEAFSFLIESNGRRIVHSADLGSPADLLPLLAAPADLVVSELAHFEPDALFATLSGRTIKRLAFIHLARAVRSRLATVKRLARRSLPETSCCFPDDGDEIALS